VGYGFRDRVLDRIGIVGSGNIGPDIALYFAKALHPFGVPVVVVDVAAQAVERGRAKFEQKLAKARESGAFTAEAAEAMLAGTSFTTDYERLRGASLVVEAATESLEVKRSIFSRLESLCGPSAILASNSSHIEPEAIFAGLRRPERTAVIHHFFPAERNPLVEIVPGGSTDLALTPWLLAFYEAIGKIPILVGSRYGYAINPVFEGLFLAAALAVEEGLGTTREVDAVARRALGLGVGPFTAMNLTGGNPITAHALDQMARFGAWWHTPRLMKDAIASGRPWEVPRRDETVEVPPERERLIGDTMRGAYFGLVGQILDTGIVGLADLELGVETGLVMRPPFAYMGELGVDRAPFATTPRSRRWC
jgi:3-hydroxyacyl-CoA dehydrogenase